MWLVQRWLVQMGPASPPRGSPGPPQGPRAHGQRPGTPKMSPWGPWGPMGEPMGPRIFSCELARAHVSLARARELTRKNPGPHGPPHGAPMWPHGVPR